MSPAGPRRTDSSAPATGTQAIDRAASLVALVVHADEPVAFTALAEESGLARSTTSRLLTALERNGLLERDRDGLYRSGPLFALYAARHDPWAEVVRLVQPELNRLLDRVRESVYLTIPSGRAATVQIAQVDSTYVLGARDWSGVEVPVHCSAAGKVLCAFGALDVPDAADADDHLTRVTPHTVSTRRELLGQLNRVRALGFASTDEELEIGLTAVAAPVRGRDGGVVAALGIHGPSTRMSRHLDQVGAIVTEHAGQISALLLRRTPKEGAA